MHRRPLPPLLNWCIKCNNVCMPFSHKCAQRWLLDFYGYKSQFSERRRPATVGVWPVSGMQYYSDPANWCHGFNDDMELHSSCIWIFFNKVDRMSFHAAFVAGRSRSWNVEMDFGVSVVRNWRKEKLWLICRKTFTSADKSTVCIPSGRLYRWK